MPISDLTGYTWVGNNEITVDLPEMQNYYQINFTSNNTTFIGINSWVARGRILYYSDAVTSDIVYGGGTWVDQAYSTIEITGGTDATNSTLIAWLEANGTLTAPSPTGINNVSIGTLTLAKAFIGSNDIVSMWIGDIEIYEKGGGSQ